VVIPRSGCFRRFQKFGHHDLFLLLHIGARAHLLGRTDQDAAPAAIDRIEQDFLFRIAFGVMNEGDFILGYAMLRKARVQLVIDVEAPRVRC
jgi:hypothetical protein